MPPGWSVGEPRFGIVPCWFAPLPEVNDCPLRTCVGAAVPSPTILLMAYLPTTLALATTALATLAWNCTLIAVPVTARMLTGITS